MGGTRRRRGFDGGGVASFRDFAAPIDGTNQVTYIRFDFTQEVPGTGAQWGGASLFEGMEGAAGTETFFAGDPGHSAKPIWARPARRPWATLFLRHRDQQPTTHDHRSDRHDPRGPTATYRLWVDNFDVNAPTATKAVAVVLSTLRGARFG